MGWASAIDEKLIVPTTTGLIAPLVVWLTHVLMRNQLYAGFVEVPEYGVRGKRGDFEALIAEDLFHRVQAVLSGRFPSTTPKRRAGRNFDRVRAVLGRGQCVYCPSSSALRTASLSGPR